MIVINKKRDWWQMSQGYKLGDLTLGEGMPKVCAPLTGTTLKELLDECGLVRNSEADLAEWRVDFFEHALDTEKVLEALAKLRQELRCMPLIFSFRTAEEGGEKNISVRQYIELNKQVAQSGAVQLIDIELFRGEDTVKELVAIAKEQQVLTIISNHDFSQTPETSEIMSRVEKMLDLGGDIPKIAVMPVKEEDVLTVLQANLQLKKSYPNRKMIMIAMGSLGIVTRMSGEIFGSVLTFAAVKHASAPGQVTANEMKKVLQIVHNAH